VVAVFGMPCMLVPQTMTWDLSLSVDQIYIMVYTGLFGKMKIHRKRRYLMEDGTIPNLRYHMYIRRVHYIFDNWHQMLTTKYNYGDE